MVTTPDQSKVWCYAGVVLMQDVTFETSGLDGWALAPDIAVSEPVPASAGSKLPREIEACVRPGILDAVPIEGWQQLLYVKGRGFFVGARQMIGAGHLLVAPSLTLVLGPRWA